MGDLLWTRAHPGAASVEYAKAHRAVILFDAAYEDMVYNDTTDDGIESEVPEEETTERD